MATGRDELEALAAEVIALPAADKLRLAAGLIDADRLELAATVARQAIDAINVKLILVPPEPRHG